MSCDYWVKTSMCYYNAFYNVYYLKNEATHKVRAGELFYKGVQKTDGEVDWKVGDFNDDLSNAHFWVETEGGNVIDWIVSFYGKRDTGVKKNIWTKAEVEALGITYKYYKNEEEILKKAFRIYGHTSDYERRGKK